MTPRFPTLIHYSARPLARVEDRFQGPGAPIQWKPRGLWVSPPTEDGWAAWCRREAFQLANLACATEVVIRPEADILLVESESALDAFNDEWGFPGSEDRSGIDWSRFAIEHDGIVIAPYIRSRRLSRRYAWYYTWDCASGCIWDAGAIAALIPRDPGP